MEQLKSCPFCGESVDESNVEQDPEICFVMCGNCGASGTPFNVKKLGAKFARRKAIEAWNVRADTGKTARCAATDDGFACSECGMPFVMTGARYCPMCGARLLDLIVTSKAPDGTETVKIITEEQLRKSARAFQRGAKVILIPHIETREKS